VVSGRQILHASGSVAIVAFVDVHFGVEAGEFGDNEEVSAGNEDAHVLEVGGDISYVVVQGEVAQFRKLPLSRYLSEQPYVGC